MTESALNMKTTAHAVYSAGLEALGSGDYVLAFGAFESLAERGHTEAQSQLGFLYFMGKGVAQDFVLAHMWFTLAADAGQDPERQGYLLARDLLTERMDQEQIAASQRMVQARKQELVSFVT